jgi:hypothetical protein
VRMNERRKQNERGNKASSSVAHENVQFENKANHAHSLDNDADDDGQRVLVSAAKEK